MKQIRWKFNYRYLQECKPPIYRLGSSWRGQLCHFCITLLRPSRLCISMDTLVITSKGEGSPGWCGSMDWAPAWKPKNHWFNSQGTCLGCGPGSRGWGAKGEGVAREKQPHIDVCLPPFPSKVFFFLNEGNWHRWVQTWTTSLLNYISLQSLTVPILKFTTKDSLGWPLLPGLFLICGGAWGQDPKGVVFL